MGVANDHSIAWGIAKTLAAQGAELAFTYQGEALGKRVEPLADSVGSVARAALRRRGPRLGRRGVRRPARRRWGKLDFVVHAIGFSDKNELKGRYADTTRENFSRTMVISCFSFTEIAQRAAALMTEGGSLITLTYGGSTRVMPNYNVMGVAKAALEASVRYLAADLGPQDIRVNAISAGPMRTLAGAGIADARLMFNFQKRHAPAAPHRHHRGGRRLGALPAVRPLRRRDRRDPLCRQRLQHHLDAASRGAEDGGRRRDGRGSPWPAKRRNSREALPPAAYARVANTVWLRGRVVRYCPRSTATTVIAASARPISHHACAAPWPSAASMKATVRVIRAPGTAPGSSRAMAGHQAQRIVGDHAAPDADRLHEGLAQTSLAMGRARKGRIGAAITSAGRPTTPIFLNRRGQMVAPANTSAPATSATSGG